MAASCVLGVMRLNVLRHCLRQRSSSLLIRRPNSTSSTQVNTEQSGTSAPPTSAAKEGTGQSAQDSQKYAEEASNKEKAELKKQAEELNDKYIRSLAETQNVRLRMQRQVDDAKKFGIQSICKDLMDVADVLERAVDSSTAVPEDAAAAKEFVRVMHEGTQMTLTQLLKVFAKYGLEKISPVVGDKFDPNIHQALFQQPVPQGVPGTIFVITKVGYKLHERTLRPALVGVVQASQ